jgi:hypothetical protein
MLREWTVGRKLALGFILSVAAVAVVGFIGYRGTTRADVAAERVAHTVEVRRHLALLLADLVELQNAVRGYVITQNADFLPHATTARDELERTFTSLKNLTQDNRLGGSSCASSSTTGSRTSRSRSSTPALHCPRPSAHASSPSTVVLRWSTSAGS